MFLAFCDDTTLAEAGSSVFHKPDKGSTACGEVIASALGPDKGYYLLCVLETAHKDHGLFMDKELTLPIKLMDLPYEVEI